MTDTAFLPHLFLFIAGGAIIAAGRIIPRAAFWGPVAFVCLFVAAFLFMTGFEKAARQEATTAKDSPVVVSQRVDFQKPMTAFALLLTGVIGLGLWHVHEVTERSADVHGLLLIALAGTLLTVTVDDLRLIWAGPEIAATACLGIVFVTKRNGRVAIPVRQAAARQVTGMVVVLIAIAIIARGVETPKLSAMAVQIGETGRLARAGLALLLAGVAIRLGLVPFHFGLPEVRSSSRPEANLVSAALPLLASGLLLYRLGLEAMPGLEPTAAAAALALAGGTMVFGTLPAIANQRLPGMLTYLVIGYCGVVMFGLALAWGQADAASLPSPGTVALTRGTTAWILSLVTGLISFAGLQALLIHLQPPTDDETTPDASQLQHLEQLQGLYRHRPLVAVAIAVLLLNLVGVPPLPGFWARWSALLSTFSIQRAVQGDAVTHWGFVCVASLMLLQGLLTAIVAFRWIKAMFFDPALGRPTPSRRLGSLYAGLICFVITLGVGLSISRVTDHVQRMMLERPIELPRVDR